MTIFEYIPILYYIIFFFLIIFILFNVIAMDPPTFMIISWYYCYY